MRPELVLITRLHDLSLPFRLRRLEATGSLGERTPRAGPADDSGVAAVLTGARAEQSFLPVVHTLADNQRFVSERMLLAKEVRVVEETGVSVGFASFGHGVLGHLFVAPSA